MAADWSMPSAWFLVPCSASDIWPLRCFRPPLRTKLQGYSARNLRTSAAAPPARGSGTRHCRPPAAKGRWLKRPEPVHIHAPSASCTCTLRQLTCARPAALLQRRKAGRSRRARRRERKRATASWGSPWAVLCCRRALPAPGPAQHLRNRLRRWMRRPGPALHPPSRLRWQKGRPLLGRARRPWNSPRGSPKSTRSRSETPSARGWIDCSLWTRHE
mmetsp:Transcript_109853/g.354386  ORF Transcript_109853/g.354386 Transcript_109853/m.354386 type:complete len:216 (+) Transcript_109853:364-1011(+)